MRQRRNQLPSNVFTRPWQRWMADQAAQLLEAARLGSDKLEVLTTGQEISNANHCKVAGKQLDDLLWRRMRAFGLDPYELALSDPLCFVTFSGVAPSARIGTNAPWI